MKRRSEILNKDKYIKRPKAETIEYEDRSEFYDRWYAKFGEPQTRTMPADKFLERLKEMIEFE